MQKIKLILPGSIRSKKNSRKAIIVGGKNMSRHAIMVPNDTYKKWEKQARSAIYRQLKNFNEPWEGPVRVKAVFYYNGNEPDLQGCFESIADCLQGIVYKDDKQIVRWHGDSRKQYRKDKQFTHVVIEKFKEHEAQQQGSLFRQKDH